MLDEYFRIYTYDDVYSTMTFEEYMTMIVRILECRDEQIGKYDCPCLSAKIEEK